MTLTETPARSPLQVRLETSSLRDLFTRPLVIPDYQRTYSWRSAHVSDLLKDTFWRTTPYLMGTIILHEAVDGKNAIVDGQQRLVTLTVLLHVLSAQLKRDAGPLPLLDGYFSESAANVICKTRSVIEEFLKAKTPDEKSRLYDLLLEKSDAANGNKGCLQFSVLILRGENALDQAYTFFDSVNSKGKPLTDFDLLKAHHLMFIPPQQEALATSHNKTWQAGDENHEMVFSTILRRIRMWGHGDDRDSKRERPDYNEFCSVVDPEATAGGEHIFNRYMQPVAFRSWRREGEKIVLSMDYPMLEGEALIPTEVTQTIEGGDSFFLYAKRYHDLHAALFSPGNARPSTAVTFIRKLADHIGNRYLQNAFRAVMLLYFDKFGEQKLIETSVCAERIISSRRFEKKGFHIEGALTHIRDKNIVRILLDSVSPAHVTAQLLAVAKLLPHEFPSELAGVRKRDFEAMQWFYGQEQSKIHDARVGSLVSYYNPNFNSSNLHV